MTSIKEYDTVKQLGYYLIYCIKKYIIPYKNTKYDGFKYDQ